MFEESNLVTRSGDPYQLMLEGQALQKSEYSGLSGLLRQGVHELYGQYFSREDPNIGNAQYESATQSKESEDRREARNSVGIVNRGDLLGLSRSLGEAAALARAPNEFERQQLGAEFQHDDTLAKIEQFGSKPFSAFGNLFKTPAEQAKMVDQLKLDANVVRDETVQHSHDQELYQQLNDAGRLKVLKLQAAGDTTGAQRMAIDNQFLAEERGVDGNDSQRLQRIEAIRTQALANFDSDAARKGKYQEAQTDDQIQSYQEEAKEAQLTAAGRPDDARTSALQFSTQHRVKSLQEAADAESDPVRKSQLQREMAAADSAGKIERDALQQELHHSSMSNTQAPALSAASQVGHLGVGGSHDGGTSNFGDAAGKLADAAMKLDKALSRSKTLVLMKD
ncbi:MAG TPA: hypothetical protein VGG44_11000 [Tepidisphaeraceae bacterium]